MYRCPIHELPSSSSSRVAEAQCALGDASVRRLPGGAGIVELWSRPERVTIVVSGDVDAVDRHAIIDVVTDAVLRGGREVRVDAQHVTFIDLAVLRALHRCHRFLARSGGSLTVSALRDPFDRSWRLLHEQAPSDRSPALTDTVPPVAATQQITARPQGATP